jgi:hypothetical protein
MQPKIGDVEHARMGEDFHAHPLNPTQHAIDPVDGLPKPIPQTSMEFSKAPLLSPETLVCMADESYYVLKLPSHLRHLRELLCFTPDEVFFSDGRPWGVVDDASMLAGDLRVAEPGDEHEAVRRFRDGAWVLARLLEPARPACSWYARILTDFADDPKLRSMERLCTLQKTEGGEHVSLRDTRIYACELRHPPDFVSADRLRQWDAERIAEQEATEEEWNADEDLGILGGKK